MGLDELRIANAANDGQNAQIVASVAPDTVRSAALSRLLCMYLAGMHVGDSVQSLSAWQIAGQGR